MSSSLLFGQANSNSALITFVLYIFAVFVLAWYSNRLLQKKSFLSEYFLGSRSLGMWAFAMTFAATSSSGGSFTGFPSKIYTHGWVLGLWIASYMVFPICTMGILGKRINQVARLSGAITIPDVLRDRFRSPVLGMLSVSLIVFFMAFNLVAQFKSGSEILKTLLQDVELFQAMTRTCQAWSAEVSWLQGVDPAYLICLCVFSIAVIVYTTYGGFHAVVWTDVLQGVVMGFGVLLLLPLALWQVGGLAQATRDMTEMTPPRIMMLRLSLGRPLETDVTESGPWLAMRSEGRTRLIRLSGTVILPAGTEVIEHQQAVEITTPSEQTRQFERLATQQGTTVEAMLEPLRRSPIVWLSPRLARALPADTRVDVSWEGDYVYGANQPGVYVVGPGPTPARLPKDPGMLQVHVSPPGTRLQLIDDNNVAQQERMARQADLFWSVPPGSYRLRATQAGYQTVEQPVEIRTGEQAEVRLQMRLGEDPRTWAAAQPARQPGMDGFLPLSLAISFFFMWAISGTGQPSNMVRLMAFNNTKTLQRSIVTVAIYYSFIYLPLVVIFCCARVMLPGMDLESDRIMPQMTVTLTSNIGQAWLAGLLVAAPFAAVMSTVDSFLLMISSAFVRDVYQRSFRPDAPEKVLKRLSYLCTLLVGSGAFLGAINPPRFLQDIIVYTGSGLAACFLAPILFAIFWPRANQAGCILGMLGGFAAHLSMYVAGAFVNGSFYSPYLLFNFNPIIVGLFASFAIAYLGTRFTPPPPEDLVQRYFHRRPEPAHRPA